MTVVNWKFLLFVFIATTFSYGIAEKHDYVEDKAEAIQEYADSENSDIKCDMGPCKKSVCECCPGYGATNKNSCEKCNCGDNNNCTFGILNMKTCICSAGYGLNAQKCQKCNCGKDFNCTFSGFWTVTKNCSCPTGYIEISGKCKELGTTDNLRTTTSKPTETMFTDVDTTSIKCDKGPCKKSVCECCPGYGATIKNECEKCDCGDNHNCTFSGPFNSKTCLCPAGYGQGFLKCQKCDCGQDFNCTFHGFWGAKTCSCPTGYVEISERCKELGTTDSLQTVKSNPTETTFTNVDKTTLNTKESTTETAIVTTKSVYTTSSPSTTEDEITTPTAMPTSTLNTKEATTDTTVVTMKRDNTTSSARISTTEDEATTTIATSTSEATKIWYEVMKKFRVKTAKSSMNMTFHFSFDHV